jgi:cation transporter-like permease
MTNTGNDRSVGRAEPSRRYNTRQALLAVLAAWVVAAVLTVVGWSVAGGERQPDDLWLLVVLLALPGLIGLSVAWAIGAAASRRNREEA